MENQGILRTAVGETEENAILRVRLAALQRQLEEARKDTERLNWVADARVFDGIDGKDIDEMTLDAVSSDSEEEWLLEWRVQMRSAIDAARAQK